ncbi:MAG: ferritin family protein [Chloroflexi bacterium]|nr:ferritin family protein [Chloroflexota bacterium]
MKDGLAIINALKFALQMEIDGKKFYAMAARESSDRVGRDLYSWLAEQEGLHYKRFEEIYTALTAEKGWPAAGVNPAKPVKMGTLFSGLIREAAKPAGAGAAEIGSADKAIEMEIKSRDYYRQRADESSSDAEKKFFRAIAAEEQGHYLALIDYREYITDPDGWFTRTEHHLLEGG